jgi:hypothetical protein
MRTNVPAHSAIWAHSCLLLLVLSRYAAWMLLVVAFELIKPSCATRSCANLSMLVITVASALLINMAAGFLLGISWHYARRRFTKLKLEKNP